MALFVEERSLFPVVVPFAPAATVSERLRDGFAEAAEQLGVATDRIAQMRESMAAVSFTSTASRSVLASMNGFKRIAEHYRRRQGEIDLIELSLWLSEVPSRLLRGDPIVPGEELFRLLGGAPRAARSMA